MKLFRRFKKPRATIQPVFTPDQEAKIANLADELNLDDRLNATKFPTLVIASHAVIKPVVVKQIPVKVVDELPPPDQITFEPANADDIAQAKAAYKQAVKSVLLNKLRSY